MPMTKRLYISEGMPIEVYIIDDPTELCVKDGDKTIAIQSMTTGAILSVPYSFLDAFLHFLRGVQIEEDELERSKS